MRRTRAPEQINAFASALTRFPFSVIVEVCKQIEETRPARGETLFPSLGTLIDECRHTRIRTTTASSQWTIESYRTAKTFDGYRSDEIERRVERGGNPDRRAVAQQFDVELRQSNPAQFVAWLAWAKQRRDGTLSCAGWCDECEGSRMVVRFDDGSKPWSDDAQRETEKRKTMNTIAIPCPSCRGRRL